MRLCCVFCLSACRAYSGTQTMTPIMGNYFGIHGLFVRRKDLCGDRIMWTTAERWWVMIIMALRYRYWNQPNGPLCRALQKVTCGPARSEVLWAAWLKPFLGYLPWVRESNLVDSASSHTLVSKIKPCMSKYKYLTVKLRTAHYISYSSFDNPLLLG